MATTTNFGWETPDDTDLVKDGAAAMRTLGNSIDTSFVDLKGGTTGQVLAKASNTDLDFTWVTDAGDISGVTAGTGITGGGTSGNVTITNDMATTIDAKGDLVVGTAADAYARLAVGTNGQVLTVDSTTATGLKWGTSTPAAKSYTLLNAGGTSLSGSGDVVISFTAKDSLLIYITGASLGVGGGQLGVKPNNTSSGIVDWFAIRATNTTLAWSNEPGTSGFTLAQNNLAAESMTAILWMDGCGGTGYKPAQFTGWTSATGTNSWRTLGQGQVTTSSTITSVAISTFGGGNFDAGTVYVYGA